VARHRETNGRFAPNVAKPARRFVLELSRRQMVAAVEGQRPFIG
jgi:hypothetical protein